MCKGPAAASAKLFIPVMPCSPARFVKTTVLLILQMLATGRPGTKGQGGGAAWREIGAISFVGSSHAREVSR